MGHLAAAGQVLAHGHLEEVEGRVQAVLVQLQLAPQVVDLAPAWDTGDQLPLGPEPSAGTRWPCPHRAPLLRAPPKPDASLEANAL